MISRSHGLVLALLLGAASATGAYAVIGTAHLGDAETKPQVLSARLIAKRSHKLDQWEASLRTALKSKPPALPALNRYAAVTFVATPGGTSLPAPASVPQQTPAKAAPAAKRFGPQSTVHLAKGQTKRPATTPTRSNDDPTGDREGQRGASAPEREATPAPSPSAPVTAAPDQAVAAAAAPAPTPPPSTATTIPQPLSVEQQCRQILRTAEGKGEQAKKEAERQCEALKQAAEKDR